MGGMTVEQVYGGKPELEEDDIRHILSMVFPDVRVKNYLEIRGADALPENMMLAYAALIKGIMYSDKVLDNCAEYIEIQHVSEQDVTAAQENLMHNGWHGEIYGVPVADAAAKLLNQACEELPEGEKAYLQPLYQRLTQAWRVGDEYRVFIESAFDENRKGAMELAADMERYPLYFRDRVTAKTLAIPKIYSHKTIALFEEIVSIAYGIFSKVIHEYLTCADYRRLFPFTKKQEELILTSDTCGNVLPIARFDIFFHEDTGEFYFCEINTDGTSAMNEDRILGELLIHNPAHQEIIRNYKLEQFELFDSWVDTFITQYMSWEGHVEKPNIAIVDFLDRGTIREFQEFARHFQRAGYTCEICDIRELRLENGKLFSRQGHIIDAIYRRAVTSDIMAAKNDVRPFLDAVCARGVFIAGSFCTQVIHNKWLFHVLHCDRTRQIMTDEENSFIAAHIPKTWAFGKDGIALSDVTRNKDKWILKPMDSYASNGVFAGVEFTEDQWEEKAAGVYDSDYIAQTYCPQYHTKNIDFAWGDGIWHDYINMAGLYVYGGRLAGIYSRLAEGDGIIASHRNERTAASFVL